MKRWIIILAILGLLLPAGLGLWLVGGLNSGYQGYSGPAAEVAIESGMSLGHIAATLSQAGVIESARLFKLGARLRGKATLFKRGYYRFEGALSPLEVMDILEEGRELLVKVTLPEGTRMRDIFAAVQAAGIKNEGRYEDWAQDRGFIKSLNLPVQPPHLEGFLFPETYSFSPRADERKVISSMVEMFLQKIPGDYARRAEMVGLSWYQAVVLASIIEKETGRAEERPVISSVFHNRLARGMKLQTDPTVIYGISDYQGNIRRKHLKDKNPYNTYVINGLPPTPIASPGLGALDAAVEPAQTSYLYFVGKGDGSHHFTTNYADHQRAVKKYQLRRRQDYRSY
ncbi:MAG: endolytic transglycosylase MltG [bacterium]|nr:endolytic transglycosylase MltG [bacterium]